MKGGVRFWYLRAIGNFCSVVSPDKRDLDGPRRSVSSLHLSPAGINAIRDPILEVRLATAEAFRRQAVNVGIPFVLRQRVLPFSEGKTSVVRAAIDRRKAGESEYRPGT
jgi:hypothetical protein